MKYNNMKYIVTCFLFAMLFFSTTSYAVSISVLHGDIDDFDDLDDDGVTDLVPFVVGSGTSLIAGVNKIMGIGDGDLPIVNPNDDAVFTDTRISAGSARNFDFVFNFDPIVATSASLSLLHIDMDRPGLTWDVAPIFFDDIETDYTLTAVPEQENEYGRIVGGDAFSITDDELLELLSDGQLTVSIHITQDISTPDGAMIDFLRLDIEGEYPSTPPDGDGSEVPEPATMLLFGTGLVGLAGYRKKVKKS